jgi:hypothetical protein
MTSKCDVFVIPCSNKDSKALLKNIQDSGKSQQAKFKDGYIFELLFACQSNLGDPEAEEYLFIAIRQDSNTGLTDICGFARVTRGLGEGEKRLKLESIATKAYSDTSYKGVGTVLIDKIKDHFKQDPSISGLFVHSEVPSVGFYHSVGFKPMKGEWNPRYMFLSFSYEE